MSRLTIKNKARPGQQAATNREFWGTFEQDSLPAYNEPPVTGCRC